MKSANQNLTPCFPVFLLESWNGKLPWVQWNSLPRVVLMKALCGRVYDLTTGATSRANFASGMGDLKNLDELGEAGILLALGAAFEETGRRKFSLAEFSAAVKTLSKKGICRYSFSEHILYSAKLFNDLEKLEWSGYIYHLIQRHDGFLPKTIIKLTPLGVGESRELLKRLPVEQAEFLRDAVRSVTEEYARKWALWARSTQLA